jgi:4-hydroxy-3-methylbut-2-enyl diphosphate reductase
MKVILASPHGFCAGVIMAIECVERALHRLGPPLYVYHEIVHNKHVVDGFRERGVTFVESVEGVPEGGVLLYSAHGVSPAVRQAARQRRLHVIDATCPLVAKVHAEVIRYARQNYTIALIGHAGHDEIVGTIGEAPGRVILIETLDDVQRLEPPDPSRLAYLTQTTLSTDDADEIISALKGRFPQIAEPPTDDICYATQNRQMAVRMLAQEADLVLVVGSGNSSNSIRLTEVARGVGTPAFLIEDVGHIDPAWFEDVHTVVLTAGASAPSCLVDECLDWLVERFDAEVEHQVVREENVHFLVPVELR